MSTQESLSLFDRFELTHPPLSHPGRFMLSLLPLLAQAQAPDADNYDNPDSVEMSLNQIPAHVRQTAMDSKVGIYLSRVVRNLEQDDDYYYNFEGTTVGDYWIIVVRSDGKLIKLRQEEDQPRSRRD